MPGSLELQGWILLAIAEGLIVASRRTGVVTFQKKNLMVSRFAISRAFVAVAESGTFSAAAVRLGCTQSAVSQQVASLERAIGHRLFIRPSGGRPLGLTTAGQLLVSHSGPLIGHMTAVRSDLAIAAEDLPVVHVGTFGSASVRLLPQIIRGFRRGTEFVWSCVKSRTTMSWSGWLRMVS